MAPVPGDEAGARTERRGSFRGFLTGRARDAITSPATRQGAWTVLDQAFFSGSNFVVNVLLARWLAPEAFGAFTTAFVVFLVCGTLHAGLLVEPMLVFGAGRFERRRRAYLRLLVLGHAGFAAGVGSVFGLGALAALALGRPFVASVVGALGVAQGGILLLWMARRACLVAHRPKMAAAGGAGYLLLLVGSAVAMQTAGLLTAATSLLLMAGVSAVVAGVLLARLGVPLRRPTPDTPAFRAEVLRAHWTYGRWSMPTGVLEWIVSTMPFLVVPLVVGVEGNALLRALLNLALPALQAFVAIAAFSLPVLVRARAAGHMPRTMRRFGALALAGALSYAVLLGGLGEWALELLYDGKYIATPAELWLLAGYPVAVGLGGVFTASLRARERPRSVFWARVGAVVLGAPTTAAMAVQWGVAGGLAGGLITLSLEAVALALSARAADPRPVARPSGPRRRRVLMVAFACDPERGSEYGQGWRFAEAAAADNDVWVLTYAGQAAEARHAIATGALPGVRLAEVAHPFERARHAVGGVPRGMLAEQVHYYVWQVAAIGAARRLHRQVGFDLVHHVTFAKYWAPSAGAFVGAPFVLGPVGGGESIPPRFWTSLSPFGALYEAGRSLNRRLAHLDPLVRATARRATLALGSTRATARALRRLGARRAVAQPSVGLTPDEADGLGALALPALHTPGAPLRVLMSGRLLPFKGTALGLRAVAAAGLPNLHVDILGTGPEERRLRAVVRRLGLEAQVTFHGLLPRPAALAMLEDATVLLHPSLHDSGGYVTLEALAAGRAVIALDLGGPGVQLTPDAGIAIPAESPRQVVRDIAAALRRLDAEPDLAARLGAGGRARIHAALRLEHVAARAFAAYADVAPMQAPEGDTPPAESSDGSAVSLDHVGFARRAR